jgi:hypothetical protein
MRAKRQWVVKNIWASKFIDFTCGVRDAAPRNADYTCEMGATRNFEQNKENERVTEEFKKKRAEEEQGKFLYSS